MTDCDERVHECMGSNWLTLNRDKTQVIWLGTRQQLAKLHMADIQMQKCLLRPSKVVNNLGCHMDTNLTITNHIAKVSQCCFFQLRQIRKNSSLYYSCGCQYTSVHAFISSRLDYCNSPLYGVSDSILLWTLPRDWSQDSGNSIGSSMCYVNFIGCRSNNLSACIFKCLYGPAPRYLTEHCVPVSVVLGKVRLRYTAQHQLVVPSTKTAKLGWRPFRMSSRSTWQRALEVHSSAPVGGAKHMDSQTGLNAFLRVFTYSV